MTIANSEYEITFTSPWGKEVLSELEELFYNTYELTRDPMEISFNNGRRNVIQFIKIKIKTAQNPQPIEDLQNE